jgi:hypothetical protein
LLDVEAPGDDGAAADEAAATGAAAEDVPPAACVLADEAVDFPPLEQLANVNAATAAVAIVAIRRVPSIEPIICSLP